MPGAPLDAAWSALMHEIANVEDPKPTTAQLLEEWREATRAAELAERLAQLASATAEQSDRNALASEEIAKMAERAARSAERAANKARQAADRAHSLASDNRARDLRTADEAVTNTRAAESDARDRYHTAEREARNRRGQ